MKVLFPPSKLLAHPILNFSIQKIEGLWTIFEHHYTFQII